MAAPGDRIGVYEIVRVIARGATATVYLARQPLLDRFVALKQIDLSSSDPTEARRLNHPNIVTVFDGFEHEGKAYIATEYLPRGSLSPWCGRMTLAQVFGVVEGILAGLAHAEEHGVVHRDLRPDHVLVTDDGAVKIADFGISGAMAAGTSLYMAPEQAPGQPVGPYTDLYALGVMMFEMLTGALLFGGESRVEVLYKTVDPRVAAWVARLLEEEPEARPPGAREAWAELEEIAIDLLGPLWRTDAALGELPEDDDDFVAAARMRPPRDPDFDDLVDVAGVAAPSLADRPSELEWILQGAARRGIVAAERPARHPAERSVAVVPEPPVDEPAVVADAPAPSVAYDYRFEDRPLPSPDRAAPPRRRRGWLGAGAVLVVAAAGGLVYFILERLLGSTVEPIEISPPDDVVCTVFAPPTVAPEESFLVQAYVHVPEHAEDVQALALEMDTAAARRMFHSLAAPIARGGRLDFELHAPGLEIDDPVATLVWRGRPDAVQFGVTVPAGTRGTVVATLYVSLDSAPLGRIKFKLGIDTPSAVEPQGDDARRYRAAFISYASKDRDEVLERVQMLTAVGIEYFQDVLSIEPGDRWQRRLELGIDECDLFLLFWSVEAKESEWVRQEVAHALERQTSDHLAEPEIKPVIIEGPPVIEPWPELAHLHFNDRILYFMKR